MIKNFLNTAIEAAQAIARVHQANVGGDLAIETKSSEIDLVTKVDKESEALFRELIAARYPDHAVLGEEEGEQDSGASHRWIIDPLDGTLNYAHSFPFYCVSIALEIDGVLELGVIIDSVRNELFSATRGGGAFLNGAVINVSTETTLRSAMLATGFPYTEASIQKNVDVFARMLSKARTVRRPGAAALDLAYVACGRLDGFWELKLNAWDVAAGMLIVQEAGGRISGPAGEDYQLGDKTIVGSNGTLHDDIIQALALRV